MNLKIDRRQYLKHAKQVHREKIELAHEINQWLPDSFIDCHTHNCLKSHVSFIQPKSYSQMFSTFPYFSIKESIEWLNFLHPNKLIKNLRMPFVFREGDYQKENKYLLEHTTENDKIALFGVADDIEYTIEKMANSSVTALKMYHAYHDPTATQIYQFFPKAILSIAQDLNKPIILHLPMQLNECLEQVQILISDFPKLKICLAHIGQTYFPVNGLERALESLKIHHQVVLDTAMVPSDKVIKSALKILGPKRVLYGSDLPVSLIQCALYIHPELGGRLSTTFPYHWANRNEQNEYDYLSVDSPLAHWQTLLAIKKAILHWPQKDHDYLKQQIFLRNSQAFFSF